VVTVNAYWRSATRIGMAPVFRFLVSIGPSSRTLSPPEEKRARLSCEITLRNQQRIRLRLPARYLAFRLEDRTQRKLSFSIIDEVEFDFDRESRTPAHHLRPLRKISTDRYIKINTLNPQARQAEGRERPGRLRGGRKTKQHAHRGRAPEGRGVDVGNRTATRRLELYDATNIRLMHHLTRPLPRAFAGTSATSNTSCGRAKSSSWTNSTGRTMQAVAGPTACTKPGSPRRG